MFFVFLIDSGPASRERMELRIFGKRAGISCKLTRMKKLTTILSLFFSGIFSTFAQASIQQFTVDDNYIQEGFIVKKIWLENYEKPTIKVLSPLYKEVNALPANTVAKPSEDVDVILGLERKRPFAFIRIPAFSKNEQSNGLQQLTSFSLSIQEAASTSKPKPAAKTTNANSVLANGNWYKIAVDKKGVYKIDYDFIKSKIGVDPSSIDTRNIRIYGNGGVILPESNAVPVPDDLVENAISISDGGDHKLDQGDYVLFYANGPLGWAKDSLNKTFYHLNNIYEDTSYYFINFDQGSGERVTTEQSAPNSNVTVTKFDDCLVYEKDILNVGRFGKNWFGEDFGIDPGRQSSRTFSFDIPGADSAAFRIRLGSKSGANNNLFTIKLNGQPVASTNVATSGGDEDYAVRPTTAVFKAPINGNKADVQITYAPGESTARGFLDYIELIVRRSLSFGNGFLDFKDWRSVGTGNIAAFQLQNANGNTTVWDVTDPLHPVRINGSLSGNTYTFNRDASMLHDYIAFDGSSYLAPQFVEKTDNQNLHGSPQVDFVIITHPDFVDAANKLADFHRQNDDMRVLVATTNQVYNEFGSGSQDIAAIRNLMRMFYERAGNDSSQMPKYLLFLGDASYDYKERTANNTNFVPTWETPESESIISGYCSDDFFSFLDDNEDIQNDNIANTMDISVGRIPIDDKEGANKVVDKIMNYASPASLGPWRLSTTIMTDWRTGEIAHFEDGELMASVINNHSNLYNETKVYLTAIPFVSTPGGLRAPEANKAINDQVYKGTFLMNYNGHGSPTTLSDKRILTQDDFNSWQNKDKLPIMVTATCTFSKYDDPATASAGELLMIKPDGGAIALLTTTQLVYQGQNQTMNVDFLNSFFQQYDGKWPTFGDAFRYGKNASYVTSGNKDNFRKFVLLGDPALAPAFPKYNITTESITDGNTLQPVDTMKATGLYRINGAVKSTTGQILNDFNGQVYVTIYDKPKVVATIIGPSRTFNVQNNIIYKGKATVTNGKFSITFITPKDLNYDFGKGKISYYAENGITDAAGADSTLTIGGFSDIVIDDNDGPGVKPFMNDSLFKDGGITGSNTLLYVQLSDETGINVSGNSIGHDLTAVLDDNIGNPYILNDYYETAPNDYKRGFVYFPVTGLSEGKHTLRVKAWDMFNNSGEGVVHFEVVNGGVVRIQNLMNYPNPFSDKTHFVFEHNHPAENLKVQINIYSTAGRLVRTINENFTPDGSRSNEITWDATDNNGAKLPAGVYVYKLSLATEKGIEATAYQKLVLIR